MTGPNGNRASAWSRPFVAAVYVITAAVPLVAGIVHSGMTGFRPALLQDMVYGRAWLPYVKRQLVPLIVRVGVAATPECLDARLRDAVRGSILETRLKWPAEHAPEFLLAVAVMYASMIAFLVMLRRLLSACLQIPPGAACGVVWCVAVALPACWAGQLYMYDYTQMLLFTAALLCMYRLRWHWFYPVFVLACISKETSVLLPGVFACWLGRRALEPGMRRHLAAQIMIGAGICGTISQLFRGNPGSDVLWLLPYNANLNFGTLAWFRLGILGLGIILALWRIRSAPVFLRRGLMATLPPLLVATSLFGFVHELRNYYEALPFGVGLVVLTLGWPLGVRHAQ